jgi:hypothetical protein
VVHLAYFVMPYFVVEATRKPQEQQACGELVAVHVLGVTHVSFHVGVGSGLLLGASVVAWSGH